MSDKEWIHQRRKDKLVKLFFILLLAYILYATFFNFKIVILFFLISLLLGCILTVIEIIDMIKSKQR
ncbi:hypothetical protein I6N95_25565 [Vagococcus sp. BWB3-3]|uniref:Uncharacterized protein n=1 Tax=Vagococcus allomyrinae TaxID=2794353 RepID=A0A940SUJ5_9ENTE|nr:hypothetical protein [Vagococcus allomyrinae]MBP1044382.1 hypothetical protein [Vagococcus allomyrinae]